MTKKEEARRLYRVYKQETGKTEVDMREFAAWMDDKGWKVPRPPDRLEWLAKQLQSALREETRRDPTTGRPYKCNLSFTPDSSGQGTFWIDVDEAERPVVKKCLVQRRDQTAGDAYQIELIQEHWNNLHPDQEPIDLPHDYTLDVMIKKANDGDASEHSAA